jgi:hypothetical protein
MPRVRRARSRLDEVSGPLTGRALQAAGALFETLAEADVKFAKLVGKEYDTVRALASVKMAYDHTL